MSNARIQFSTATEERWIQQNPDLREGELVLAKKPSGSYKLSVGAPGGSSYQESVVVWDADAVETILNDVHSISGLVTEKAALVTEKAALVTEKAALVTEKATTSTNAAVSAEQSKLQAGSAANAASEHAVAAANAKQTAMDAAQAAQSALIAAQEIANNASAQASAAGASAAAAFTAQNQAAESAVVATSAANTAEAKADLATEKANMAATEAERAEGFANAINPDNFLPRSDFISFRGATPAANGSDGLVPAPSKAQVGMYLRSDGTWAPVPEGMPIGAILPFAGQTIPAGYLACNGATVSRSTYAALYTVIGTRYGSGNGSTTFNLPLLEDSSFLEFDGVPGAKKNAGLPNITGSAEEIYLSDLATTNFDANCYSEGALYWSAATHINKNSDSGSNGYGKALNIDASRSSAVYGGSTTVQPKSVTVRAIIKY